MDFLRMLTKPILQSWEKNDRAVIAKQILPDEIAEIRDVAYLSGAKDCHRLDLYYPKDASKVKSVLVDIHGGGFLYGDKSQNRAYGYEMAKRGFLVCNVNYRLAQEGVAVPEQIWDISKALSWLDRHLSRDPGKRSRVFLSGDSAGAVHAVFQALLGKSQRLRKIFHADANNLTFRGILGTCGFYRFYDKRLLFRATRALCFEKGYQATETYRNMLWWNLPELKSLPPVFLVSGEQDSLKDMTVAFYRMLKQSDVMAKLLILPKGKQRILGHIVTVKHPEYPESQHVLDSVSRWFHELVDGE